MGVLLEVGSCLQLYFNIFPVFASEYGFTVQHTGYRSLLICVKILDVGLTIMAKSDASQVSNKQPGV